MSYPVHPPPPRGMRLRAVQPLLERDGSCPLLYDLERARLVEVPLEFHYHVALALDTADLDEDLIAWLAGEDVLTYEGVPVPRPAAGRASAPGDGLSDLDRVFFFEDRVHCRLGGLETASALATVHSVLARSESGTRVCFHLTDDGGDRFHDTLYRVVDAARSAGERSRRVDLELITDGANLTRPQVRFLAAHDVSVRLTAPALRALDQLLVQMPERLTLSLLVDTGDRLLDLWHEARKLGVHRVDAVKVTDRPFAGLALHESELRRFRRDLFEVSDDMFDELEAGHQPQPLYEPLARVVGRHLAGRPQTPDARLSGYVGVVAHGELFTFFGHGGGGAPQPAEWPRGESEVAIPASDCDGCWARPLCVRGALAGPAADPHRPEPRPDRCEFWRAEVEVGLLFYQRLLQADPGHLLGFADGREEPVLDPYPHLAAADRDPC